MLPGTFELHVDDGVKRTARPSGRVFGFIMNPRRHIICSVRCRVGIRVRAVRRRCTETHSPLCSLLICSMLAVRPGGVRFCDCSSGRLPKAPAAAKIRGHRARGLERSRPRPQSQPQEGWHGQDTQALQQRQQVPESKSHRHARQVDEAKPKRVSAVRKMSMGRCQCITHSHHKSFAREFGRNARKTRIKETRSNLLNHDRRWPD
jgi:hypothetical protein